MNQKHDNATLINIELEDDEGQSHNFEIDIAITIAPYEVLSKITEKVALWCRDHDLNYDACSWDIISWKGEKHECAGY